MMLASVGFREVTVKYGYMRLSSRDRRTGSSSAR
jgi:hypothetical protein